MWGRVSQSVQNEKQTKILSLANIVKKASMLSSRRAADKELAVALQDSEQRAAAAEKALAVAKAREPHKTLGIDPRLSNVIRQCPFASADEAVRALTLHHQHAGLAIRFLKNHAGETQHGLGQKDHHHMWNKGSRWREVLHADHLADQQKRIEDAFFSRGGVNSYLKLKREKQATNKSPVSPQKVRAVAKRCPWADEEGIKKALLLNDGHAGYAIHYLERRKKQHIEVMHEELATNETTLVKIREVYVRLLHRKSALHERDPPASLSELHKMETKLAEARNLWSQAECKIRKMKEDAAAEDARAREAIAKHAAILAEVEKEHAAHEKEKSELENQWVETRHARELLLEQKRVYLQAQKEAHEHEEQLLRALEVEENLLREKEKREANGEHPSVVLNKEEAAELALAHGVSATTFKEEWRAWQKELAAEHPDDGIQHRDIRHIAKRDLLLRLGSARRHGRERESVLKNIQSALADHDLDVAKGKLAALKQEGSTSNADEIAALRESILRRKMSQVRQRMLTHAEEVGVRHDRQLEEDKVSSRKSLLAEEAKRADEKARKRAELAKRKKERGRGEVAKALYEAKSVAGSGAHATLHVAKSAGRKGAAAAHSAKSAAHKASHKAKEVAGRAGHTKIVHAASKAGHSLAESRVGHGMEHLIGKASHHESHRNSLAAAMKIGIIALERQFEFMRKKAENASGTIKRTAEKEAAAAAAAVEHAKSWLMELEGSAAHRAENEEYELKDEAERLSEEVSQFCKANAFVDGYNSMLDAVLDDDGDGSVSLFEGLDYLKDSAHSKSSAIAAALLAGAQAMEQHAKKCAMEVSAAAIQAAAHAAEAASQAVAVSEQMAARRTASVKLQAMHRGRLGRRAAAEKLPKVQGAAEGDTVWVFEEDGGDVPWVPAMVIELCNDGDIAVRFEDGTEEEVDPSHIRHRDRSQ